MRQIEGRVLSKNVEIPYWLGVNDSFVLDHVSKMEFLIWIWEHHDASVSWGYYLVLPKELLRIWCHPSEVVYTIFCISVDKLSYPKILI